MTFTDSHPICELHNPDNIVKEWWGVQLIQVRWNQLVTGLSAGELFFWVLPRTVVQNGEFRHKPSTVNCFNCLWSNVKQEPREQLKFLGYRLNSVISYKHRWLVLGNYFLSSFYSCSAKWGVQAQTQHCELLQLFMIGCETRTERTVKVFGLLIKFSYLI